VLYCHSSQYEVPALILDGEPKHLNLMRPELWVALPTSAFTWWTRSLGGTVVVGMLLFWLAGKVDPMWFAGL
jgi:branched-subunit amino acid transport protein